MIGKLSLAAALAGALMLVQPGGSNAASLSHAGTAAKPGTTNTVTQVRYRRKWRNHRGYRRHWRYGRYYNHRYYRRRYYRPRYYSYNPYYYGYRSYRPYWRPYRRYHRPRIGIYISF
jgi:hypothetical protein